MPVAAENRWANKLRREAKERHSAEVQREVVRNEAQGAYDHVKAEAEMRRELGQAVVKWESHRPKLDDYATKAEALAAAKLKGPKAFPLKCFTAFESFWTVAIFSASGWRVGAPLSVEAHTYVYRPATPDEVANMGFRRPPKKSVYIATLGF